jgi:hypothetical protein
MILGVYSRQDGGGARPVPRIVQVSIAPLDTHRFRVVIHEEGAGLAYHQDVDVPPATEAQVLALVADLHRWSTGLGLTEAGARSTTERLGRTLYRTFLGRRGGELLASLRPTALLLDVDESVLGLPWEAMRSATGELALDVPFGRIVTTGARPLPRRDPTTDDPTVKILAIVNPTDDLAATTAELAVLRDLAGGRAGVPVKLDVLEGAAASRRGLAGALRGRDHDIVHFAGHARFDAGDPHDSSLLLSDGELTAEHVRTLAWASPPYLVFNSACQSARVANGRALVAAGGRANGLPAAFLAAGCGAYVGHFWPVGDVAAAEFAACFYGTLFGDVDAGAAVLDARRAVRGRFDESADLAAFGAVFFGDVGTADGRIELAEMV